MDAPRKVYVNEKWRQFSNRVKGRDGFRCLQCGRSEPEVVLQVHHDIYLEGKPPWEYLLSDCLTLCRGCHAREHDLIEPARGWTLIAIEDLGGLDGVCERRGCGHEIRYAHVTYHPAWGYKTVGSTCIQHLTQKDRLLSSDLIRTYKNISEYIRHACWSEGRTKNGKRYICSKYKHHSIRIYGNHTSYAFQLVIKEKGVRWYDYRDVVHFNNKGLDEVKELAYVALKGTVSKDGKEKELLRGVYRRLLRTRPPVAESTFLFGE